MKKNIVALVTLYHPDPAVTTNMEMLSKQVSTILLLDNTPNTNNSKLFEKIENSQYYANYKNLGLSVAFNNGLRHNSAKNSDYIIFFDQDSQVTDNLINSLIIDFERTNAHNKVGCVGPLYHEKNSNEKKVPNDKLPVLANIYSVKNVITSSMLTKYEILDEIGFWNEKIFLDLADWDLCWRLRQHGYMVCLSLNAILNHTLGSSVKKILFLKIRQSNSIREYYGIRDSIKLFSMPYTPFKYKLRFIITWTLMPAVYLTFLPKRIKRYQHIVRGYIDGLKGINGEFGGRV